MDKICKFRYTRQGSNENIIEGDRMLIRPHIWKRRDETKDHFSSHVASSVYRKNNSRTELDMRGRKVDGGFVKSLHDDIFQLYPVFPFNISLTSHPLPHHRKQKH